MNKSEIIEWLISELKTCVVPSDENPKRRELDSAKASRAIDLFLDRLNDLPPDWEAVRDHLQNAVIKSEFFSRDDDVQLCVHSDPTEYMIVATLNLGTALTLNESAGADTPEDALKKLGKKLNDRFPNRHAN
jgi:hypothetical protein